METSIVALGDEVQARLREAHGIGFDRFLYTIELLQGEAQTPLQVAGGGWSDDYLPTWLSRLREDPLRRMVARGEVPLSNLPIFFENLGSGLSLPSQARLSAGEVSLLRWSLAQGVRTGVSLAIRMPRGLYATANFYGGQTAQGLDPRRAVERLFLLGHEIHARLEAQYARSRGRAEQLLLSRREAACLEWIARGKTNRQIADILGISVDTVKEYVQSLMQKLDARSRAQVVARAVALGYLS